MQSEGRNSDAERLLRHGVDRFPDDAHVRVRAALVVRDSDRESSLKWLREASTLGLGDPGIQFRVAQALFDLDDFAGAAAAAAAARDGLTPDFELLPELLHLAGRITLAVGGDDRSAEIALREAFELSPEVLQHAQVLAQFYVERERWDDGRALMRDARRWHAHDSYLVSVQEFLDSQHGGRSSRSRRWRTR